MAMNAITMAVLQIQALALLLPSLSHAIESPSSVVVAPLTAPARSQNIRLGKHRHNTAFNFNLPTSSTSTRNRLSKSCHGRGTTTKTTTKGKSRTITNSLAPDYFSSKDEHQSISYSYVPPYGMVPRKGGISSNIVLNMAPPYNDYSNSGGSGVGGGNGGGDGRFRKKMNSRSIKDPVVQDFGNMRDWQASKTGVGRMGDDKMGDDGVSERFGMGIGQGMMYDDRGSRGGRGMDPRGMDMDNRGQFDLMDRRPPPPPGLRENDEMFEGEGGNFWVNPTNSMDRYPDGRGNEGMSRSRRGNRRSGRRNNRRGMEGNDEEDWWETRREDGYDDDEFGEFEEFDNGYQNEYGVPPPSRSRSSFRSGAPPPPRPVKQFYDKLFWFGFDPDVTRSTDRTMFGGTRGKFNAMDMLRDRDQRQQMRAGGGGGGRMMRGSRGRGGRSDGKGPVVQDFGSVSDWNARRNGSGRTGGDAVGDDQSRPNYGYDSFDAGVGPVMGGPAPFPGDMPPPMPPPGMPDYDIDAGYDEGMYLDDMDFEDDRGMRSSRGRDRGGRRRRRENRRRDMDGRAMEYDRFLSGGGDGVMDMDDEEYIMPGGGMSGRPSSRRRRSGFAYKFNSAEDLFDGDGEYIDVGPKYATERDLDMARGSSNGRGSQRRRSWEERAIEMDRVPPRGAVAWGPNGRIGSGEDPLDRAAMEALRDIKKAKKYLLRKENAVEDAKEEVVTLKADATFLENQIEDARGREADKIEQELGYLLRDVEDASRNLRLARAERDAASDRLSNLEERNWALLSEYEAVRSFEDDMN